MRIQLQPLTNEGRTIDGHGGRNKKRVHYHDQGHLERKTTHPGIDKEAIRIPEPAQRPISVFEKYFAYIMAPGDRETARRRGLVGKPLLYESTLVKQILKQLTQLQISYQRVRVARSFLVWI